MGNRKWGIGPDKGLKVGDKVIFANYSRYAADLQSYRVAEVERITPSGRLVIGGQQFYNDLSPVKRDDWRRSPNPEVWSQEREQELENELRVQRFRSAFQDMYNGLGTGDFSDEERHELWPTLKQAWDRKVEKREQVQRWR